ncbi:MAG: ATP-binding protein [Campylobacterota bacterium]|nr:ATP-binding protein [Campylobacterota bacterium]
MLRYGLILFFTYFTLLADYTYYKIVVGSFSKENNANRELSYYENTLADHDRYQSLVDSGNFEFSVYHGKKYHTLNIFPFRDRKEANAVLAIIHNYKTSPYLSRYKSKTRINFKEQQKIVAEASSLEMEIEMVEKEALKVKVPPKVIKSDIKKVKEKPEIPKVIEIDQPEKISEPVLKEVEPIKEEVAPVLPLGSSIESNKTQTIDEKPVKTAITKNEKKGDSMDIVNTMLSLFPYFIIMTLVALLLILMRRNRNLEDENRDLVKENSHLLEESIETATIAKTKDEFLTKMSHEIRTPMNAIIGFSHILLETKLNTNQLSHLRNIQNSADLLLSVINDILNFSKIDFGNTQVQKLQFNINSVLDDISLKMSQQAHDKELELIFEIANNVPSRIVGDEEKLRDVISNLISNAIKYTNFGEIIFYMKRLDSEAELIVLECSITDTGIGIQEEALSKLFDSFVQVDNSNAREYDGMGLGLAIVKEYVHLMGGEVSVTSEFGKGSCFTFVVTLDSPAKIDPRNYRLPDKNIMNKKVLVVDSNTNAAGSLQRMIAYYHYHADIVATEDEAIRILQDHEYDILCLDSKLSDEILSDTIQRYKEFTNAKIILLENDVVKKLDTPVKGIDAELQKPFNQQDIFDTIIELYSEAPCESKVKLATKEGVSQFKGETILLAEDNRINQSVIKSLLENTGIILLIANNGKEAIDLLYAHPETKMIFMDISMPIMNGYDAAKSIRKDEQFTQLPIVALTANVLPSDIEKSLASGMQEHIGKPFNVTAFYDAIIKYLSPRESLEHALVAEIEPEAEVEPKVEVAEEIIETKVEIEAETEVEIAEEVIETKVEIEESTAELIEWSMGLALVGDDKAILQELLDEYIEMYSPSGSKLAQIIEDKDYDQGQKVSHDIKGVSANLGLTRAFESIRALEMSFKAKDADEAKIRLEHFVKAFELTKIEIEA